MSGPGQIGYPLPAQVALNSCTRSNAACDLSLASLTTTVATGLPIASAMC